MKKKLISGQFKIVFKDSLGTSEKSQSGALIRMHIKRLHTFF